IADTKVADLRVVESMHERKALMAELSDAFIALPGGYGTFEEFCEVLTWTQLGLHRKPCGILNVEGYYDPLLALFDHAAAGQFVKPIHRRLVVSESQPEALVNRLLEYDVPMVAKWLDHEQAEVVPARYSLVATSPLALSVPNPTPLSSEPRTSDNSSGPFCMQ